MHNVVFLKSRADVQHLKGGEIIASENPELLKESLHRHPRSIDPTLVRSFYRQEGLVVLAKDAGVPFQLPLLPVLRSFGSKRARLFYEYRRFLKLCGKKKAGFSLVLVPENEFDKKSARELEAVATVFFGFTTQQAKAHFTA